MLIWLTFQIKPGCDCLIGNPNGNRHGADRMAIAQQDRQLAGNWLMTLKLT